MSITVSNISSIRDYFSVCNLYTNISIFIFSSCRMLNELNVSTFKSSYPAFNEVVSIPLATLFCCIISTNIIRTSRNVNLVKRHSVATKIKSKKNSYTSHQQYKGFQYLLQVLLILLQYYMQYKAFYGGENLLVLGIVSSLLKSYMTDTVIISHKDFLSSIGTIWTIFEVLSAVVAYSSAVLEFLFKATSLEYQFPVIQTGDELFNNIAEFYRSKYISISRDYLRYGCLVLLAGNILRLAIGSEPIFIKNKLG